MPSSRRATFSPEVFDNLKAMFEQAPEAPPKPEPTTYSKLELVRGLSPTIAALAKRGWSWKALAAMMTQRGVAISADLLKAYVAQSQGNGRRPKAKKAAVKAPTSHPARAPVPSAAAPNAVLDDASSWDETMPTPKAAPTPPERTTPARPPRALPVSPPSTTGVTREPPRPSPSAVPPGTFVMRPDTPDL